MQEIIRISEGIYLVSLMFLLVLSLWKKKPSKLLGILLLPSGLRILWGFPEKKIGAWVLIAISTIYLLRGIRVVAYRSKPIRRADVGGPESDRSQSRIARKWGKAPKSLLFVCFLLICLGLISFLVKQFHLGVGEAAFRLILTAIALSIAYLFFDVIGLKMLAPLFSLRVETRRDVIRDVLWVSELLGRSTRTNLHILWEQDKTCFITYALYAKKWKDLIGYECEYRVYTGIPGSEFLLELPRKLSDTAIHTKTPEPEELSDEFFVDHSLRYEEREGFFIRNRWFFISFFGLSILLLVTICLLHLFVR